MTVSPKLLKLTKLVYLTILVIILSALYLCPVSALFICDCSSFIIENVTIEPSKIYYNQNFNVSVVIRNNCKWSIAIPIEVKLIVGLNESDRNRCLSKGSKMLVIPKHSTNKTEFSGVNFNGLYDPEFEKWKINNSDNKPWTKAWIEVEIIVLNEHCKGYFKTIGLHKPPSPPNVIVNYNNSKCPETVLFDYIIDGQKLLRYLENLPEPKTKADLELKVYNFQQCKYESKGFRSFNGTEEYIKWSGIELKPDNFGSIEENEKASRFQIVIDNKGVWTYDKPIIYENFSDMRVYPGKGRAAQKFKFSLTFNSTICEKIRLLVYNYMSNKWDYYDERIYNTPRKKSNLIWNVKLSTHHLDSTHDAKYKFESMFFESEEKHGPFYDFDYSISNVSVSPTSGLLSDGYTYSIDINSERELSVTLKVRPPNSDKWISFETKKYSETNKWKTLKWTVTPFENVKNSGNAKYCFEIRYKNVIIDDPSYDGPCVDFAVFRNASVTPKFGTKNTTYKFCVECRASENEQIILYVLDSNRMKRIEKVSDKKTNKTWSTFCFILPNFPIESALGNTTFYFELKNRRARSEECKGPTLIDENLSNFKVEPCKGTNQTDFTFEIYPSIKPKLNESYNLTLQLSMNKIDWIDVIEKPYKKYVVFQNVSIDSLNLTNKSEIISEWKQKGTLYWRIRGYATTSKIVETKWDIDLKFLNHSFSPKKAWWNDTLLFTTTLSAKANGFVELQLKTDNGNILNLMIPRKEYNNTPNNQTFNWTINLEKLGKKEYEGKVKYRFIFYWGDTKIESRWYDGPTLYKHLKVNVTSASVYPASGYSGCLPKYFEPIVYHYCINLSANKNTIVKLIVISPSGKRFEMNGKEYTRGKSKEIIWESKENQSLTYNELGTWTYVVNCSYFDPKQNRFVEKEYYRCNGPRVYAFLNNFTIEPKYVKDGMLMYGDKVNISFDIKSVDNISVTLYILTQGEKHRVDSRNVRMNTTTKLYFLNIDPIKYLKNTGSFSFSVEVSR